jgi:ubiquinone/menaquinone biosynthesis C-methylase UbiE
MDKQTAGDATLRSERALNNFDFVSPIYDALAVVSYAGSIKRAQLALLPEVKDINTAVIVGGGTGWFLVELLSRTNVRHVTYVDLSASMLRKSKELLERTHPEWMNRVEFRLGSHESLTEADGPYDLVVTNFLLDLFSDENCFKIAQALSKRLAPSGRWMFVDFLVPERGLARWVAIPLYAGMFTFFRIMSETESRMPPDYEAALTRLGLTRYMEKQFHFKMIRAWLLRRA